MIRTPRQLLSLFRRDSKARVQVIASFISIRDGKDRSKGLLTGREFTALLRQAAAHTEDVRWPRPKKKPAK